MRVFVAGATGTIGRATVRALQARGHDVVALVRPGREGVGGPVPGAAQAATGGLSTRPGEGSVIFRIGDVTDAASLQRDGFRGERFDAVVSCLASRSGAPADAWAIDHAAQCGVLKAAQAAGVGHFVLLSAICVQRPLLAFQHAKLAFEAALVASGLRHSIVRPTAFFKSLSGQVARVQRGRPFLVFGDGTLTACKPISDRDLGDYLAACLDDPARHDRILPIGGPGPALTPLQQGLGLFQALGRPPRFKHVPVGLLDAIVAVLGAGGRWLPPLAAKAELARIGRYYATESMLVLNPATGRYDADATPSTGSDTLFDHYAQLAQGTTVTDLGAHAVFK